MVNQKDNNTEIKLGKIKKVKLREIWKHEAYDFTNWLIKPENMTLLNDVVGIKIDGVDNEVKLLNSKYHADILAQNNILDTNIVIENQLEVSNHDHLGKILTYAANLEAEVLIWIVKKIREEHKKAVQMINSHSDKTINIFVLELSVIKIGDSLPAPQFNVVIQPENWLQTVNNSNLSTSHQKKLEFWKGFENYLNDQKESILIKGKMHRHYIDVDGRANFRLICLYNQKRKYISVEIYIPNDKILYDLIFKKRDEIDKIIETPLDWQRLNEKKAARIKITHPLEPLTELVRIQNYEWYLTYIRKFQKAFIEWL